MIRADHVEQARFRTMDLDNETIEPGTDAGLHS
jgi:hypothetical protein